jgi:thiol-disulfide isomerase/thioredoxin
MRWSSRRHPAFQSPGKAPVSSGLDARILTACVYNGTMASRGAALISLFLTLASTLAASDSSVPIPLGGILPDVTLRGINGPSRKLSDFRGSPLIINMWASWCGPCRAEMASLERVAWRDRKPHFGIIGISTDDDPGKAAALIHVRNTTISHFIDSHQQVESMLGASRLPLTVLIDRNGRILKKIVGATDWDSDKALQLIDATFAR